MTSLFKDVTSFDDIIGDFPKRRIPCYSPFILIIPFILSFHSFYLLFIHPVQSILPFFLFSLLPLYWSIHPVQSILSSLPFLSHSSIYPVESILPIFSLLLVFSIQSFTPFNPFFLSFLSIPLSILFNPFFLAFFYSSLFPSMYHFTLFNLLLLNFFLSPSTFDSCFSSHSFLSYFFFYLHYHLLCPFLPCLSPLPSSNHLFYK